MSIKWLAKTCHGNISDLAALIKQKNSEYIECTIAKTTNDEKMLDFNQIYLKFIKYMHRFNEHSDCLLVAMEVPKV